MFVTFHQLPLALMFAVILAIGVALCWLLIGLVRFLIPRCGYWLEDPLPSGTRSSTHVAACSR